MQQALSQESLRTPQGAALLNALLALCSGSRAEGFLKWDMLMKVAEYFRQQYEQLQVLKLLESLGHALLSSAEDGMQARQEGFLLLCLLNDTPEQFGLMLRTAANQSTTRPARGHLEQLLRSPELDQLSFSWKLADTWASNAEIQKLVATPGFFFAYRLFTRQASELGYSDFTRVIDRALEQDPEVIAAYLPEMLKRTNEEVGQKASERRRDLRTKMLACARANLDHLGKEQDTQPSTSAHSSRKESLLRCFQRLLTDTVQHDRRLHTNEEDKLLPSMAMLLQENVSTVEDEEGRTTGGRRAEWMELTVRTASNTLRAARRRALLGPPGALQRRPVSPRRRPLMASHRQSSSVSLLWESASPFRKATEWESASPLRKATDPDILKQDSAVVAGFLNERLRKELIALNFEGDLRRYTSGRSSPLRELEDLVTCVLAFIVYDSWREERRAFSDRDKGQKIVITALGGSKARVVVGDSDVSHIVHWEHETPPETGDYTFVGFPDENSEEKVRLQITSQDGSSINDGGPFDVENPLQKTVLSEFAKVKTHTIAGSGQSTCISSLVVPPHPLHHIRSSRDAPSLYHTLHVDTISIHICCYCNGHNHPLATADAFNVPSSRQPPT